MSDGTRRLSRRRMLQWLAAAGLVPWSAPLLSAGAGLRRRPIPGTDESLPVIGMGSWLTFDVGDFFNQRESRCEVLKTFFEMGGALVDSSPMYGQAEEVIGKCLAKLDNDAALFAATKVWTWGDSAGREQMAHSRQLWGVPRFDLMQIHNLLDWETHLPTLRAMKAEGAIRYIGITTSHGRRHDELARIMANEDDIDFVQFTYNLMDRTAEQRLLPLAAERGLAVIINRPFRGGTLFDRVQGKPLPGWAAAFDCHNWAQFFLKFIVSHPAVTCAIPATTKVTHMRENMGALQGRLPDQAMRERMVHYFATI